MKRFKLCIVVLFICMIFNTLDVKASDNGFIQVKDEAALDACLNSQSNCKLVSDIAITNPKEIDHELILDLNGYSIEPSLSLNSHGGMFYINRGGKLTINDTKGNGKISTGSSGNVWAAIQLLKSNDGIGDTELTVNNGTIEGYYYGIVGNGNNHYTKTTINGGTIKGLNPTDDDNLGIYHPQKGEVIINGGTIEGGTGIEMRSGNLTVYNGNIIGNAKTFTKTKNKNGSTTNGVGIAIAQHTTKNDINVAIHNGKISGKYALYEWNPHDNSAEDISKIDLHIYGGEFITLDENGEAVYSQDLTNFISGGKFNSDVSKYTTENAKLTSKIIEETPKSTTNNWAIIFTVILILGGVVGMYIYQKRN